MANPVAALIVRVAADLSELKTSVGQIESTMGNAATVLKSTAGAIAGAFAALGLGRTAQEALDTAGRFQDLSEQMGISAESVQALAFAATQGGSSLETVARAIKEVASGLNAGDKGAVKSLDALNLTVAELRAMAPDQAFVAIADAIKDVPNPMQQSALAVELFGRSGAELLPVIKAGIAEVGAAAPIMRDQTVAALAQAGDRWEAVQQRLDMLKANALAPLLSTFASMPASLQLAAGGVSAFMPSIEGLGMAVLAAGGPVAALGSLKTALLAIGPAVAVAAVALASWKVGEKIGEVTGLTDWVGKKLAGAFYGVSEAEYEASRAAAAAAVQHQQMAAAAALGTSITDAAATAFRNAAAATAGWTTALETNTGAAAAAVRAREQLVQAALAQTERMLVADREANVLFQQTADRAIAERIAKADAAALEMMAISAREAAVKLAEEERYYALVSEYRNKDGLAQMEAARLALERQVALKEAWKGELDQIGGRLVELGVQTHGAYGAVLTTVGALFQGFSEYLKQQQQRAALGVKMTAADALQAAAVAFGALGQKYKAFAIAEAIIATYLSIAKTLATTPWPVNLVLAAGAAAAGFANVQMIRNSEQPGFATGTFGRYVDFGAGTSVMLHGRERVMTEAEGRAENGRLSGLEQEVRGLRQSLESMLLMQPTLIATAMRDYGQLGLRRA